MALDPLVRGDYEVIDFVVMEPDPSNPGQERERNITNDSFVFVAKRSPKDALPTIEKSSAAGDGITKSAPTDGEGYVEILPEDTENFSKETALSCYLQGVAPVNKPYTMLFNLKVKYHG